MKSRTNLILATLLAVFLLSACGKDCGSEECPNVTPSTIGLRLLNNADQDLLAGPAKVYDTTQVRITARKAGSSTTEEMKRFFLILKNGTGSADSLITTTFVVNKNYATYYLVLNNTVTDSLVFGYNNLQTACCDLSTYYLDKVNQFDIQNIGLPSTYILRK